MIYVVLSYFKAGLVCRYRLSCFEFCSGRYGILSSVSLDLGVIGSGRQVQASSDKMRSVLLGCVIAGMAI